MNVTHLTAIKKKVAKKECTHTHTIINNNKSVLFALPSRGFIRHTHASNTTQVFLSLSIYAATVWDNPVTP